MEKINDGGPAFPRQDVTWPDNHTHGTQGNPGMSLRDYFAAKAISVFETDKTDLLAMRNGNQPDHEFVAKFCYDLADAMIAAREKT